MHLRLTVMTDQTKLTSWNFKIADLIEKQIEI